MVDVQLKINGAVHKLRLDPRTTLLDLLRENLQLTGSKKGCDHGQCGACTVLINGRRVNSCLTLAVTHEGDEITTIEGLAKGDQLHPMQAAFPRARWLSMRLLHAGPDLFRGRLRPGRPRQRRRADSRIHERQSLPLRRLSEHRRRDQGSARQNGRRRLMNPFSYSRASDPQGAISGVAANPTGKISRRRHQSRRPDEDGRRTARRNWSISTGSISPRWRNCLTTAASASARSCATPISPSTR